MPKTLPTDHENRCAKFSILDPHPSITVALHVKILNIRLNKAAKVWRNVARKHQNYSSGPGLQRLAPGIARDHLGRQDSK